MKGDSVVRVKRHNSRAVVYSSVSCWMMMPLLLSVIA
jgi:hypothetical protein